MQPVARYGALYAREAPKSVFRQQHGAIARFGTGSSIAVGKRREAAAPWTCDDCRTKLRRSVKQTGRWQGHHSTAELARRAFTVSTRCYEEDARKPLELPTSSASSAAPASPSFATNQPPIATAARSHDTLSTPASTSSSLPSRFAERRNHLSQNLAKLADNLLSKASLASQQINTYTGTDFSGIEALRSEIIAQEDRVKTRLAAVSDAKDRHVDSHAKQAASQKEIVSLLERKSSWGPADLERYMSLVRSEHLDEQGVTTAKTSLADAERELEDSRALLERLERKQYHEEQIWSDTIRRNSTWVTIGLMGVNIVLLLANIAVFEPWRRRKIVREVKAALDEKSISHPVPEATEAQVPLVAAAVEPEVKTVVAEEQATREKLEAAVPLATSGAETAGETPLAAGEVLPEEVVKVSEPATELESQYSARSAKPGSYKETYEAYRLAFLDLFSQRLIELKKVDVTTIALQGAASGVAVMGFLFLLLRPK